MNSKTILMILSAYNAAVGLLLFFAAAVIAKQALPLASDEVLDIAAGNNQSLGVAYLGIGILTFFIRNAVGDIARNAQIGWGIAGSLILLNLVRGMLTYPDFHPPIGFLITGTLVIAFAFWGATKTR